MSIQHFKINPDGGFERMTDEEVEQARVESEQRKQEKIRQKGHDCEDIANGRFIPSGHSIDWYCNLCGDLISAG